MLAVLHVVQNFLAKGKKGKVRHSLTTFQFTSVGGQAFQEAARQYVCGLFEGVEARV